MKKRIPTYLTFCVGKEWYAVSTLKMFEVVKNELITPVPNALPYIHGLIAFRGNIIPVISLNYKLLNEKKNLQDQTTIIIFDALLKQKKAFIAASVEAVSEVIAVSDNEILPPVLNGIQFNDSYLQGIIKKNEKYFMLLDMNEIFDF